MLQTLVSHNHDLLRLIQKGYALAVDSNYLIARDIPYLGADGGLRWGAIVTQLEDVDGKSVQQKNHQVSFAGAHPCELDGAPIRNLGGGAHSIPLSEVSADVVVERQFSNKPEGGYPDFFAKLERYVAIISGPAIARYGVTPYTFKAYESGAESSVFKFRDMLTTRAEIGDLSQLFGHDVIAVIGLGGTGAYLIDFLTKTPVREIRCFDPDVFHVHNAFRSPGHLDPEEFRKSKAEVYGARYENFRTGLRFEPKFIDSGSAADLEGVTFAFVCVDKGSSRSQIFDLLISLGIPFIDVGMGLNRNQGPIGGQVRTTYLSAENAEQVRAETSAPTHDNPDDIYKTTIQISELNALNACLAIIRFKQQRGFYLDRTTTYELIFGIGNMMVMRLPDAV